VPTVTQASILESHLIHWIMISIDPKLSYKPSIRAHELIIKHLTVNNHGHVIILLKNVINILHMVSFAQADVVHPVDQWVALLNHTIYQLDHDSVRVDVFEQFKQ